MFLFAACVNVPRSNLDAKDGVAVDVVAVANARVCQDQIKDAAGAQKALAYFLFCLALTHALKSI